MDQGDGHKKKVNEKLTTAKRDGMFQLDALDTGGGFRLNSGLLSGSFEAKPQVSTF